MLIRRTSQFSGKVHEMDLDITQEQVDAYVNDRHMMIQNAFPRLSAAEREFFKTGITDEEWQQIFPPEEE
jgi:hypothetical protein